MLYELICAVEVSETHSCSPRGDDNTASQLLLIATARNNLALCLKSKGSYPEAEELYLAVIKTRIDMLGSAHEETIVALHNLAELYRSVRNLFPFVSTWDP